MTKKIMIVDDDKGYSSLIQYKLQNGGYETEVVNFASNVLRLAMDKNYDLILLDHQMPDVVGSHICDYFRSEEKLKHMPIIVVTGHHELAEEVFKNYGATDVIYKPFEDVELFGKIKKYLGDPA